MPSRGEGFGIVYLEAMRHQLACIGSIHDAAGEIIVDGETGFLVNQDNSTELATKVVQLLTDSSLCQRLVVTDTRGCERTSHRIASIPGFQGALTNWARKPAVGEYRDASIARHSLHRTGTWRAERGSHDGALACCEGGLNAVPRRYHG